MTIRARDLFPDPEERFRVKAILDLFNAKIVKIGEQKFGTTYEDTRGVERWISAELGIWLLMQGICH